MSLKRCFSLKPIVVFLRFMKFEKTVTVNGNTFMNIKGQLISKANCQAMNSSKKRTNEFVFTIMQHVFVCFLEEIEVTKKTFQN